MKNMYVIHADTFMILKPAIRTAESLREQLLKISLTTGYVLCAE